VAGAEILLVPSCTDPARGYFRVRTGAQARALENQIAVVHAPTVGLAPWSPAVDVNVGAAAVYVPADLDFPDDGVLAIGVRDAPQWVHAEIDLDRLARCRLAGDVLNARDWPEQDEVDGCVRVRVQ
jgi:predicted amidohydrolase